MNLSELLPFQEKCLSFFLSVEKQVPVSQIFLYRDVLGRKEGKKVEFSCFFFVSPLEVSKKVHLCSGGGH